MKIIQYLAISLFLCLSHHVSANDSTSSPADQERFYDLFPGTLLEKNNQLYLHSCQTMDAEFKLKFNHPADEQRIRKLMQKYNKFWLYLTADADMQSDEYLMTVDGIAEEHLNKTCHLTELLDEL